MHYVHKVALIADDNVLCFGEISSTTHSVLSSHGTRVTSCMSGPVPSSRDRADLPTFFHPVIQAHPSARQPPRELTFSAKHGLFDASRFLTKERWRGWHACECGRQRPVLFLFFWPWMGHHADLALDLWKRDSMYERTHMHPPLIGFTGMSRLWAACGLTRGERNGAVFPAAAAV